jgi:hypothetical protein
MHYVKEFDINGVDTRQVACIELHGKPNAATEGCVGVLGIDMDSPLHDVYKCVAVNGSVYTWELLSSGLSIMSATISGGGTESVQFPYENLLKPDTYVVKIGDLIIDSEGFLYQIAALNNTYCSAKYTETQVVAYGKSAYVLAVQNGFKGSEEEWLASLKGDPGITPHIGENGNWWLGDEDTLESAAGNTPWTLVAKYDKAGSYTWTCPKDGEYVALIVGGGGCGEAIVKADDDENAGAISARGGGCGKRNYYRGQIVANAQITVVVGAGGFGGVLEAEYEWKGSNGGTSSFNGVTAAGGTGGGNGASYSSEGAYSDEPNIAGWDGMGLFLDENNIPVTLCCVGCAVQARRRNSYTVDFYYREPPAEVTYCGRTASPAQGVTDGTLVLKGVTPTDCGAGGGGIVAYYSTSYDLTGLSLTRASGADGGVFIYKVRSYGGGDGDDNGGGDGDDNGGGDGDDNGESTIPENILSSGDGYLLTDMNGVYLMPA